MFGASADSFRQSLLPNRHSMCWLFGLGLALPLAILDLLTYGWLSWCGGAVVGYFCLFGAVGFPI